MIKKKRNHGRRKFEILRIEVRLNRRQKIKKIFEKLKIKSDLTFKKIFKPSISKKILLHYLDELESKRPIILDYKLTSDKELVTELILNNPEYKLNKILRIFALKKLLVAMNIRELRNLFSKYSKRNWYSLMNDLNNIKLGKKENFETIRKCIIKFKPFILNN